MRVNQMIARLQQLQDEVGDVDVLITDGFQARCYRGKYDIAAWKEDSGEITIDIGIGGCEE